LLERWCRWWWSLGLSFQNAYRSWLCDDLD
jgi:hypothetical protein